MIKKLLTKRLPGFMGRTHAILTVCLFALCMIIPLNFFKSTFWVAKENILLFIVSLIVITGASLLPDLDGSNSVARNKSGPLGSMFTIFMQSSSHIVWTLYHGKSDRPPMTQHRYLWHSGIIGPLLAALFYFKIPDLDHNIFQGIKLSIENKEFGTFIFNNSVLFLFIVLAFMSALIGSSMLLSRINEFVSLPWALQYILPAGVMIYILTASFADIRLLGFFLGCGYFFHVFEDFFADSGVPMFWPIPLFRKGKMKVWWRARFPITVTTGGLVNTVIDFIAFFVAIGLMILVFAL